jgi:hypothetical protein
VDTRPSAEDDVSVSEQRKMNAKVLVRFTEDDLWKLQQEADRQGVSVPQLMREFTLSALPKRRTSRSVPTEPASEDEQARRPAPTSHVA